jgi:hypothetical protein
VAIFDPFLGGGTPPLPLDPPRGLGFQSGLERYRPFDYKKVRAFFFYNTRVQELAPCNVHQDKLVWRPKTHGVRRREPEQPP